MPVVERARRAIDGDDDHPVGVARIDAGVDGRVGDVRGVGVDRRVAELAAGAVVVEIHVERGVDEARAAVELPQAGGEDALAAEDAQHVGLGDRAGDVVAAAVVVFGDGDLGAGIEVVDVALDARQQSDRALGCPLGDPAMSPQWLIQLRFGVGRIPERARGLDAAATTAAELLFSVMRMPPPLGFRDTSGGRARPSACGLWAISVVADLLQQLLVVVHLARLIAAGVRGDW